MFKLSSKLLKVALEPRSVGMLGVRIDKYTGWGCWKADYLAYPVIQPCGHTLGYMPAAYRSHDSEAVSPYNQGFTCSQGDQEWARPSRSSVFRSVNATEGSTFEPSCDARPLPRLIPYSPYVSTAWEYRPPRIPPVGCTRAQLCSWMVGHIKTGGLRLNFDKASGNISG